MYTRDAQTCFAAISASLLLLGVAQIGRAQDTDEVTLAALASATPKFIAMPGTAKTAGLTPLAASAIPGIDTLTSFNGSFKATGYDPSGNLNTRWYYSMVGQSPDDHGTTTLNAPIVPVSLDLRNYDGSPRYVNGQRLYYDATPYVQPTLNSPVFQKAPYSSSERPTQFADAIQRAEFFDEAEDNWHTLLAPSVKTARVMTLIRGTYRFAVNPDGTCCLFVLIDANTFQNLLFPPTYPVDNSTVMGAAELAGDVTTADVSTFLFPNAYLYIGIPANCCILGFHSFDFEPGTPANGNRLRFYVMNYSSWISPGLFGGGFADVTALSHEVAETFNDPFVAYDGVHGVTPWWLAPNGNCQDNLEVGDPIEGLPNGVYPISLNGFIYHPQNIMLLNWFEFQSPSRAIHHAYSYPNTSLVTALSPLEKVNCQ
jgi:hypothetical protein